MTTPMTRGYALKQLAKYIDTKVEPDARRRMFDAMPQPVRGVLASVADGEWYPRDYAIAMQRAIATVRTDEDVLYNDLVACGEYIAAEATNTFLKLLMRIVTPTLFAKKIPDFWKRDQRSGHFEVDVSNAGKSLVKLRLSDVEGFDHIGPVCVGFMKFGWAALGKPDARIIQRGWSRARPGPSIVDYEVSW